MKREAIAAAFVTLALTGASSCKHKLQHARTQPRMTRAEIDSAESPMPAPTATIMAGVVAPRLLPRRPRRACDSKDREHRHLRMAGLHRLDFEPRFSPGEHQWRLLDAPRGSGLARDIEIHLDRVPLDLDRDGTVDTHVTRDISLKGGILGNPEVFGLAADPDDPPGKLGYTSASTGFSGLRDALIFRPASPPARLA